MHGLKTQLHLKEALAPLKSYRSSDAEDTAFLKRFSRILNQNVLK